MRTTWKYNEEIIGRADNIKNDSFFLIYNRGKNFESDNLFESYKNSVCVCVEKDAIGATEKTKKEREEERKEDECWRYKNCRRKTTCGYAEQRERRRRCSTRKEGRVRTQRTRRQPGERKVKRSPRLKQWETLEQLEGWRTRDEKLRYRKTD